MLENLLRKQVRAAEIASHSSFPKQESGTEPEIQKLQYCAKINKKIRKTSVFPT